MLAKLLLVASIFWYATASTVAVTPTVVLFGTGDNNLVNNIKSTIGSNVVELTTPVEVYDSPEGLTVGIIADLTWKYDHEKVEALLTSLIEREHTSDNEEITIFYKSTYAPKSEYEIENNVNAIHKTFDKIKNESLLSDSSSTNLSLNVVVVTHNVQDSHQHISNIIKDKLLSYEVSNTTTTTTTSKSSKLSTYMKLSPKVEDSKVMSQLLNTDKEFVTEFMNNLNSVTNMTLSSLTKEKPSVNAVDILTKDNLKSALEMTLISHYEKYKYLYEYSSFIHRGIVQLLSYRVRLAMFQQLHVLYTQGVENLRQLAIDSFDTSSKRIMTSGNYPQRMYKRSQTVLGTFKANCDTISQAMKSVIGATTTEPGLYNKQLYSKVLNAPIYDHHAININKFSYSYAIKPLSTLLKDSAKEKIDNSFLMGRYNPFIRNSKLPPIRLNFNYLLDPRAMLYSWSYEQLYDEHMDGSIVTNRANPLLIKGVAAIPFDPNSHPVPKENKAWWKVLQDFFNNEL